MNSPIKKLLGAIALAACVVAPQVASAQSFAVRINGQTCSDGAACDLSTTAGVIIFSANVNGYIATISIGSTNTPGGPAFSFLDTTWNVIGGPNLPSNTTIDFLASATGFTFPATGSTSTMTSMINGNVGGGGGSVSGQAWLDFANGGNNLFSEQGVTTGLQGIVSSNSTSFLTQGPYSMTQHLYITLNANGITTGDFLTQVVPEPAPLALIGIALAGLAFARRRQQS